VISLQHAQHLLETEGVEAVPAKTMIRVFANMAASQMAMRWGLHGPQMTLVQACATGVDVVGTAAQLVRSGVVDVAIAGGYEATNGFEHGFGEDFVPCMVAATVAYGMAPSLDAEYPSRPFDKNRTGVVTGEAAAYVIVEAAEHAAARGRQPWARVEGYGSLADGYHPSSPDPTGQWEREVMQVALDDAGIAPDDVDAVIAHGTATRKGDDSEIAALNDLFGDREVPIPATSIKGHMGHPGAASGCLAVITAALAMRAGSLVHTAGTTDVEDTVRFEVVTDKPKAVELRHVLVNAFGFGGQNAAVVLGAPS
jgi:3-oxoacyl-[acyl-carrier-protein] synthase II